MSIYGNSSGGFGFPKTFILTDEKGTELTGVVTDSVKVFDATADDVKFGKIFASDKGILEGKNTITYRTTRGFMLIEPGCDFSILMPQYNQYNYTQLQCLISPNNNKYAVEKTVLDNAVYQTQTGNKISDVTINHGTKSIDFNFINNTDIDYRIYFFMYREET